LNFRCRSAKLSAEEGFFSVLFISSSFSSSTTSSVFIQEAMPYDELVGKMSKIFLDSISFSQVDDFDEAVKEFYKNLQIFESTR
jgi:hypothetical protein